jgi:hypothetical protein
MYSSWLWSRTGFRAVQHYSRIRNFLVFVLLVVTRRNGRWHDEQRLPIAVVSQAPPHLAIVETEQFGFTALRRSITERNQQIAANSNQTDY